MNLIFRKLNLVISIFRNIFIFKNLIFRWFFSKNENHHVFKISKSLVKNSFGLKYFSKSFNVVGILIINHENHIWVISRSMGCVQLTAWNWNRCLTAIFQIIQNGAKDSVRIFSSENQLTIIIAHHRNRQECIRAVSSTLVHSSTQHRNHGFGELFVKMDWSTFRNLQLSEAISTVHSFLL